MGVVWPPANPVVSRAVERARDSAFMEEDPTGLLGRVARYRSELASLRAVPAGLVAPGGPEGPEASGRLSALAPLAGRAAERLQVMGPQERAELVDLLELRGRSTVPWWTACRNRSPSVGCWTPGLVRSDPVPSVEVCLSEITAARVAIAYSAVAIPASDPRHVFPRRSQRVTGCTGAACRAPG